ncbi:MAG: PD-(D/E)XK nuclease family protein [Candidatus Riflebacteria bacterium]|nr:PD-(D/E)XK nuclease family protein [Candidatus Riflebacteria bacterium]
MIETDKKLEDLKSFIERYDAFTKEHYQLRFQAFKRDFCVLSSGLEVMSNMAMQVDKSLATRFNLFKLLQVERSEVYTHSAILADLLDPRGTHGQGSLFLEGFLKMLFAKQSFSQKELNFEQLSFGNPQNWLIEKEKVTAFGRLDLVISSINQKIIIVIENKIFALEQKDQLKRYGDWLNLRNRNFIYQTLCYLTPYGLGSNTAYDANYTKLSYREDIFSWLTELIPFVGAVSVVEALKQYIAIVRKF